MHIALYTQTTGSSGTVQINITYNTGYATANLYSGTIQLRMMTAWQVCNPTCG